MGYAENTAVPSDRSRAEIERTLNRYGADDFAYATRKGSAAIQFVAEGRRVRFTVQLPERSSREFSRTPTGRERSASQVEAFYEQAVRQRWRALALVIKAKLEAVESGISVFEEEFLANIVLPGGQTVYESTKDAIELAYITNQVGLLLEIEGR
jgi:hypothetical protein